MSGLYEASVDGTNVECQTGREEADERNGNPRMKGIDINKATNSKEKTGKKGTSGRGKLLMTDRGWYIRWRLASAFAISPGELDESGLGQRPSMLNLRYHNKAAWICHLQELYCVGLGCRSVRQYPSIDQQACLVPRIDCIFQGDNIAVARASSKTISVGLIVWSVSVMPKTYVVGIFDPCLNHA